MGNKICPLMIGRPCVSVDCEPFGITYKSEDGTEVHGCRLQGVANAITSIADGIFIGSQAAVSLGEKITDGLEHVAEAIIEEEDYDDEVDNDEDVVGYDIIEDLDPDLQAIQDGLDAMMTGDSDGDIARLERQLDAIVEPKETLVTVPGDHPLEYVEEVDAKEEPEDGE